MRNFLDRIRYYFRDCYGIDKLSTCILVLSVILSFISFNRYVELIAFALLVYVIFRTISRNKYKRYQELAAFNSFIFKMQQKFYSIKASFTQRKDYKILKCPNCSQKLRLPRNKGKVTITCSKCGTKFKAKS